MSDTKIDEPQRQFLTQRTRIALQESPELRPLLVRLLQEGGEFVVLPAIEEDLNNILSRGRLWTPKWLKMMPGENSMCHRNSALLWEANKKNCKLCTGYGLSKDGIWRQHSWCSQKKQVVVETTTPRELYFGFEMTPAESEKFLYENE